MPTEVFLSHSSIDRAMAGQIANKLRAHGVPTFFTPSDLVGAQQWQNEMLAALRRCDWFLVLLSKSAIESMWVRRETAFALSDKRYENRIVPLDFQRCDLGSLEWLRLFQMINFHGDFNDALRDLLRVWGIGLRV
jgi:hypothetical protein